MMWLTSACKFLYSLVKAKQLLIGNLVEMVIGKRVVSDGQVKMLIDLTNL